MSDVSSKPASRSKLRLYGLTGFALALGLLFWARLIVVSDLPRTAIADEKTREAEPRPPRDGAAGDETDTNPDFGPEGEKSPPQVTEDPE